MPAFHPPGRGEEIVFNLLVVDLNVIHGGLNPAVTHEFLNSDEWHPFLDQVAAEGMAELVRGEFDLGQVAVLHQMLVNGGGGKAFELVAEEDMPIFHHRANGQVGFQECERLAGEIHGAFLGVFAKDLHARFGFFEIQVLHF